MVRPQNSRHIQHLPEIAYFIPHGIPLSELEEVIVTLDELESLRLADVEGLYHEEAAQVMSLSRATFGRIIESARRKVAQALIRGKALRIEGGNYIMTGQPVFHCNDCHHEWPRPLGVGHAIIGRPKECPICKSRDIYCREEKKSDEAKYQSHYGIGRNRKEKGYQRRRGQSGGIEKDRE